MLVWKQILWLRERVREQRAWIDRCGGDLAGYIARYGDPGVAPMGPDGQPKTLHLTPAQQAHFPEGYLRPVPGLEDYFYAPHCGDGGTAIYQADCNRLKAWQYQLEDLSLACTGARMRADEEERTMEARKKIVAACVSKRRNAYGEWVVRAFGRNGKRIKEADYHTQDYDDAVRTSVRMVNRVGG